MVKAVLVVLQEQLRFFNGNGAIKVNQGANRRVIQTVAVTPGAQYRFEFVAKNDASSTVTSGTAYVKFLTANFQPISSAPFLGITQNWTAQSQDYIAPANAAFAEINFNASSTHAVFADDVCFGTASGPPPCSLSAQASNIQCDDNGTPMNESDDTFTFDVTVLRTGSCGDTWSTANRMGPYGVATTFGPYAIASNLVILDFSDEDHPTATSQLEVTAPAPCSNGGSPQADLLLSAFQAPASGQTDEVINYTFDLQNVGNGNANGAFSIKAYFSTDDVLSNDDLFDGLIPTGN